MIVFILEKEMFVLDNTTFSITIEFHCAIFLHAYYTFKQNCFWTYFLLVLGSPFLFARTLDALGTGFS